jgi:hypothetical protein
MKNRITQFQNKAAEHEPRGGEPLSAGKSPDVRIAVREEVAVVKQSG